MKIKDSFMTSIPVASIEALNRWYVISMKIHDLICDEEVFNPLTDELNDIINMISRNIDSAEKDLEIAKQNEKYIEDRPNA